MVSVEASTVSSVASEPKAIGKSRRWPIGLVVGGGMALAAFAWWRLRPAPARIFTGTIECRTVRVGSRSGGRVQDILAREGEIVRPGQPLVRLEPGDLLARKRQAQGEVAAQEAQLTKLEHGSRPQEIAQARARAATASAALRQVMAGTRS